MTQAESKAAKKARNEAAYAARNTILRERQTLANKYRKLGYVAVSDEAVIELFNRKQRELADIQKQATELRFVDEAVNGPYGKILRNWLKNREATFERVSRFFAERPGLLGTKAA